MRLGNSYDGISGKKLKFSELMQDKIEETVFFVEGKRAFLKSVPFTIGSPISPSIGRIHFR